MTRQIKTTKTDNKNSITNWLWKQPARFAVLVSGLMVVATAIYTIIGRFLKITNPVTVQMLAVITVLGIIVFSVYKLVKWLPDDNLNRRDFVTVNNGAKIIHYLLVGLMALAALLFTPIAMYYYVMWLQSKYLLIFFAGIFIISLGYLYLLGIIITNIYIVYKRALAIGIPKSKAILSLPFSVIMLWLPGYILDDNKKSTDKLAIKSRWFARLGDWVLAHRANAISVFLISLIICCFISNLFIVLAEILLGAIFGIWLWQSGDAKFKKNISGAYSSFAVAFNIAVILVIIFMGAFINKSDPQIATEQSVVVETAI